MFSSVCRHFKLSRKPADIQKPWASQMSPKVENLNFSSGNERGTPPSMSQIPNLSSFHVIHTSRHLPLSLCGMLSLHVITHPLIIYSLWPDHSSRVIYITSVSLVHSILQCVCNYRSSTWGGSNMLYLLLHPQGPNFPTHSTYACWIYFIWFSSLTKHLCLLFLLQMLERDSCPFISLIRWMWAFMGATEELNMWPLKVLRVLWSNVHPENLNSKYKLSALVARSGEELLYWD